MASEAAGLRPMPSGGTVDQCARLERARVSRSSHRRIRRRKAKAVDMYLASRVVFGNVRALPLRNRIRIAWRLVDTSRVIFGRRATGNEQA